MDENTTHTATFVSVGMYIKRHCVGEDICSCIWYRVISRTHQLDEFWHCI